MAARRSGKKGAKPAGTPRKRGSASAARSSQPQSPTRPAPEATALPKPRPGRIAASGAVLVGRVRHWYGGAGAALVALEGPLAVGDFVHVRGATTDAVLLVTRLERDGAPVKHAAEGSVGVALPERVRPGDRVYRVTP
jgi:hypothetical protein